MRPIRVRRISSRTGSTRVAWAGVLLTVLVTAGCGLPQDTTPLEPDASGVPYRLLSPTESEPTTAERGPQTTSPDVYLLTADERLVPVEAPVRRNGLGPVIRGVLARLTSGPSESERSSGLASALGPDVRLTLTGVVGGTATVELDLGAQQPGAARLPLAVAQVVLSTASVEGVDRVQLVRDGAPVEVPLPDGSLTRNPVTSADYAALLANDPVSSSKARPT